MILVFLYCIRVYQPRLQGRLALTPSETQYSPMTSCSPNCDGRLMFYILAFSTCIFPLIHSIFYPISFDLAYYPISSGRTQPILACISSNQS